VVSELLRVGGQVITPQDFDFAALRALPDQIVEASAFLPGREIAAVPLAALLTISGVTAEARSVVIESADGRVSTTLPLASVESCVIQYRVGSSALPTVLGGPFRLLTRGRGPMSEVNGLGFIHVSERRYIPPSDTERVRLRDHRLVSARRREAPKRALPR
jgi:hypothetical protein